MPPTNPRKGVRNLFRARARVDPKAGWEAKKGPDPFSRRRIAGFFILFLAFYGLLMAPWPGVRPAYAAYFRAVGTWLFGSFGAKDAVRFRPAPEGPGEWDTVVVLSNPHTGAVGTIQHDSRNMGYVPTAMLLSLVLATPFPLRRKGRTLLWGFLLVNFYVALRIALVLLRDLSQDDALCLFPLGPFGRQVLAWAVRALVMSPGSYFAFPVFIWILVTFRRSDWRALFPPPPPL